MTIVETQTDPHPGRCPSSMRFEGMGTRFECVGDSDHRYPWHWFEDSGVKVYWLGGVAAEPNEETTDGRS